MTSPALPTGADSRERSLRLRAIASAEVSLALSELLRAGARLPEVVTAMAARRSQLDDPAAPAYERVAVAVRDGGSSLFQALHREQSLFTPRFMAVLAVASLGGPLFRTFVQRLREFVTAFNNLPPDAATDFPPMADERGEFCFFLGHLTHQKASQSEIQHWLPRVFTARLRLVATHVLARFYEQGLELSEAFQRTPPFDDPEMVLALEAGERMNRVGLELIELADWLAHRRRLEERLRFGDYLRPVRPLLGSPGEAAGEATGDG